jgi:hypothetical protein
MSLPRIEVHPEILEAQDRTRIEAEAAALIETPQWLREVDAWSECLAESHSDLARMFRNVEPAFKELSQLPAGVPATAAVLQAVVNLRRTCLAAARNMVEGE